jgi:drug/metabolite transporter superfamily protein YnfA
VQLAVVHVQPVPVIFVTVKPEGGFSATVTVPLVGPPVAEFETVTVYVAPVCPCVKFPVCDFVMESTAAAPPLTVVVVVKELFSAFGSGVVEVTLAVFVSVPDVVAVTTRVIAAVAALFIVPSVQVTVVVPVQVPTEGVADTSVAPVGNTSVIVTAVAARGPLLVTVIV